MVAWRCEISLLVLKKNISLVRCAHLWNVFQHSKRNFVPLRGHVISSISQINISYSVVQGKPPWQHNFCQGRIWMSSHSFTCSMISPRVRSETWILTKKFWNSRPGKKLENEGMEKRWTVFLFQIVVVKSLKLSVFCSQNIQWRKKRIFRTLLCAHCIVVTFSLQCIIGKVCFLRMSRSLSIWRLFHNLESIWKKKIILFGFASKLCTNPCDPCVCPLPVQLLMVRVICHLATKEITTKKSTRRQPTRHQVMTL